MNLSLVAIAREHGRAAGGTEGPASELAGRRFIGGGVTSRIDARGVLWRRWSERTIPWSEIAGYAVQQPLEGEAGTVRFISLWLLEPARWPADHPVTRLINRKRLRG